MARTASPLDRGLLGGLAGFRLAAWAWMAIVLWFSRDELDHPLTAGLLVGAALVLSAALAWGARQRPLALLHPATVAVEVVLAAALNAADGWVFRDEHDQSLVSAWPLAGVLAAGIAGGPVGGGAAGLAMGAARAIGSLTGDGGTGWLPLLSTAFLYTLAGVASGLVVERLRRAEDEISAAKAREEVARTLHDGVLQTLAVVQRRAPDTDLADLARTQERELRQFLFGLDHSPGDLLAELRRAAAHAEERHGLSVSVSVVDEPGRLTREVVAAVAGAAGEALTNAAKHGGSSHVVVFVDPGPDGLLVSVNDDGSGFDPAATPEGVGLSRSIRGRLEEVGGTVEVRSAPGDGTEVALRVPN